MSLSINQHTYSHCPFKDLWTNIGIGPKSPKCISKTNSSIKPNKLWKMYQSKKIDCVDLSIDSHHFFHFCRSHHPENIRNLQNEHEKASSRSNCCDHNGRFFHQGQKIIINFLFDSSTRKCRTLKWTDRDPKQKHCGGW